MPAAWSSSGVCWLWVVLAGWITSVLASPMLARCEASLTDSMNLRAASRPPLMPKPKIDPQPFGKYFWASL